MKALVGARPGTPTLQDLKDHKASHTLAEAAYAAGWNVSMPYGVANGYPWLTVKASHQDGYGLRVSWHTFETGTLRLFSKIAREPRREWHDLRSLKSAHGLIAVTSTATGVIQ